MLRGFIFMFPSLGRIVVLLVAVVFSSTVSAVRINEFMAANDGGASNNSNGWHPIANQVPGTSDDWIEIFNDGGQPLNLEGWSLTDDADDLMQWVFPPGTILPAGAYLLVYASGDGVPDSNGNLHTNFRLSAGGEYLALVDPMGIVVSEFGPGGSDYPAQEDDISYGLESTTPGTVPVFFSSPTPGAVNDGDGVVRVADTTFSLDRGYYQTAIDVEISTDTVGATIYYTLDGTRPIEPNGTPTANAIVYTAPVSITETTALRAAATMAGAVPTNVDTQTYILLDIDGAASNGSDPAGLNASLLDQVRPAGWGDLSSGDFEMDTRVTRATATATNHSTSTAQTMLLGMRDIPTISISMDRDDFSGLNGIYFNSETNGLERECSAEFIPANNGDSDEWQIDCGIRVQGGASRIPVLSPKHALSLRFRAQYGESRLREQVFPDSNVDEFNSLSLRAGFNNSWFAFGFAERARGTLLRDQWMRQSMLDMGNPSAGHGLMTHLFINGLYWGVHNLTERQDSSHYAAYNGGDDDLLDARNGGAFVDGSNAAYDAMQGVINATNATDYWTRVQSVLDVDQYIDYQIINRYADNLDISTSNNWRAAGGGPFPTGQPEQMAPWSIYSWDAEFTLIDEASTSLRNDPVEIRDVLETNEEYRIRFADRLQKHFFNGGALAPSSTIARWTGLTNLIDRAIIAESARWGDHRTILHTRDNQWLTEVARLRDDYFPVRTATVLTAYGDLYPSVPVPEFQIAGVNAQTGGVVPVNQDLQIVSDSGTVYYTTDGGDPRLEGGAVAASASSPSNGNVVSLGMSGLVRARTLENEVWSALVEAEFFVGSIADASNIVVTELFYNPAGSSEDTEFIELMNIDSDATVDLSNLTFEGVDYTFPLGTTLASGQRVLIVRDRDAFESSYDTSGLNIAPGEFGASLSNGGEEIAVVNSLGADVQRFVYDDSLPWPTDPDGDGYSLVLIAPSSSPDHTLPQSWRASAALGGNPGNSDAVAFFGDFGADEDGDGLSAFLEHALGTSDNNVESDLADLFGVSRTLFEDDEFISFSYRRNLAADDVVYELESSNDLMIWLPFQSLLISSVSNGDGTTTETYRSSNPLSNQSREFIRLRVSPRSQ